MHASSAQRKLLRGVEHVKTLCGEAKAFEEAEAYVFLSQTDVRSPHEIHYRTSVIERQAPNADWSLLAGEAIQNMRSALDHAVWSIASKRARNRAQYPIFTDPCEFQVHGLKMLPGVPEPIRTLIEETQPYRRLPQAPTKDALEQLRTFANIDKHRTLSTFAAVVDVEYAGTREDIKCVWEKTATKGPLGDDEAEIISVLVATSDVAFTEMDVNPDFSYEVRIEGKPLDLLEVIARRVWEAVRICETGQPLPPLSTYPI